MNNCSLVVVCIRGGDRRIESGWLDTVLENRRIRCYTPLLWASRMASSMTDTSLAS